MIQIRLWDVRIHIVIMFFSLLNNIFHHYNLIDLLPRHYSRQLSLTLTPMLLQTLLISKETRPIPNHILFIITINITVIVTFW